MLRILWIEDEEEFISANVDQLELEGHQVQIVATASDGYRQLKEAGVDIWDVVLLDIVLPPGDPDVFSSEMTDAQRGIALLKKLKQDGVSDLPPIVIVSGVALNYRLEDLQEEFAPHSIRGLLYKPLYVQELLELIE